MINIIILISNIALTIVSIAGLIKAKNIYEVLICIIALKMVLA